MKFFIVVILALSIGGPALASSNHKTRTKVHASAKKHRSVKKSKHKTARKSHKQPQQVSSGRPQASRALASSSSSSSPHLGALYVSKYFQRDADGRPGAP